MTQKRLNNLAVLNCHKNIFETLDLRKIVYTFINKGSTKENILGIK